MNTVTALVGDHDAEIDARDLNRIGDAIFASWYPDHQPGDPTPTMPPAHVMREARALAARMRKPAGSRPHAAG